MSYCTLYSGHKEAELLIKKNKRVQNKLVQEGHTSSTAGSSQKYHLIYHQLLLVLEKCTDCEAGEVKVFSAAVFLDIKNTQLAQGQKQTSAFLVFVLQLPHTNQISHFQGFEKTKRKT